MKFYSLLLVAIIICFTASLINSQDARLLDIYNKETISYEDARFYRDGQMMKFKELKPLLMKFPDSARDFTKYNKQRRVSLFLAIPSVVLIGQMFIEPEKNRETKYAFAFAGIVGLYATNFITNDRLLPKSVWLYNRDILLEKY